MPIIREVNFNNLNYPDPSYISEWINLSSSAYTVFTVYCSENCDIKVVWAVDDNYQIIDEDSISLTGGTAQEVVLATKTKFAQFQIINIASNPCDLKVQGWFYTD